MAQTPSTMTELGSRCPDFALPATDGVTVRRDDFNGSPLLVMFICNHCPFVKHIRNELANLGREYQQRGVGIVAINSNDVENYPDDSPEKMAEEARDAGYSFPYLFDETQEVARGFDAACTPDLFLYDASHKLVYRGQLDDSRPRNDEPVDGHDLRAALDAVLAGEPVPEDQKPSIGCNIKWKP
ncbi:MAG: thioredoxin family protein [Planctomycetota bacterium]|jgi:peroxiredoxin